MNRQQKRHSKSNEIPQGVIANAMKEELVAIRKEVLQYATTRTIAAFVVALHDVEGFGHKRLKRVLEKVNTEFECVDAGMVTLDDLLSMCTEYGITIKEGNK